jgi:hypothetical protein
VIVLNTAKELVKVEAWAEIEVRPGFTTDLDPRAHTLDAIIGRYVFSDRIRCGLSNCHTPHAKGYIVATKDGHETNIGKDCGRTYFGVDFEALSRKFDQDITEKENREKLWSFSFRLDELKEQIDDLRSQDRGGNWVYRLTRPLLEAGRGCPPEIVRRLGTMVKTRLPLLTAEREATAQEIENLEAIQGRRLPRPHYVEEPFAEVAGLEALYPENDLRDLLVLELGERIKKFEEESIDALSYESLRKWAKWIGTIDATIDKASASIASGRRLLSPENLEPFAHILRDPDAVTQFRTYIRALAPQAK